MQPTRVVRSRICFVVALLAAAGGIAVIHELEYRENVPSSHGAAFESTDPTGYGGSDDEADDGHGRELK